MTTTPQGLRCKRGDTILVAFPNADLRSAKSRPALVIQADGLDTGLPQLIVAMITSNLARANHPSRITIQTSDTRGRSSGLLADSVVMTDNIATVTHKAVGRVIGHLAMGDVDAALRRTLQL